MTIFIYLKERLIRKYILVGKDKDQMKRICSLSIPTNFGPVPALYESAGDSPKYPHRFGALYEEGTDSFKEGEGGEKRSIVYRFKYVGFNQLYNRENTTSVFSEVSGGIFIPLEGIWGDIIFTFL